MARKTRSSTHSKIETVLDRLKIRKCVLTRNHSGKCWDEQGAFE